LRGIYWIYFFICKRPSKEEDEWRAPVGICASKWVFAHDQKINSAGDGITTAAVGFNLGLGKDGALYNKSVRVFGANGAAVLYSRKMLDEIGFLDDDSLRRRHGSELSRPAGGVEMRVRAGRRRSSRF
jgi:hypothetical protein